MAPTKTKLGRSGSAAPSILADVTVERSLLRDEVARRAYEIWEREGNPSGRDLEHWVRAEEELRSQPAPANFSE